MKKIFLLCLLAGSLAPQKSHAISYTKAARIGFETISEILLLSLCGVGAHLEYKRRNNPYDTRPTKSKIMDRGVLALITLNATLQLGKKVQKFARSEYFTLSILKK